MMADHSDAPREELEAVDGSRASAPAQAAQSHQDAADAHWAQLEAKLRSGANWFYWIAGLSVINSLISLAEGDRQFIVGLGITQVVVGIAVAIAQQSPDAALIMKIIAGVFTLVAAGVFAGIGLGSGKRLSWLFVTGMALYGLDALLYLAMAAFGEPAGWLPFGFHIFVLTRLFSGFQACRALNAAEAEPAVLDA
jgi:hypothetical protein